MNKAFNIIAFFRAVDSIDLGRNIQSFDRNKLAEEYLELYSFVKKDQVFVDFMRKINGVQYGSPDFFFILYGFGFPENEIVFSLPQYMNAFGFLMLGEYVDKRTTQNWRGVVYAYNQADKSSVIYAKFDRKDMPEIMGRYYPLCIGFKELVEIVLNKSFDEQFRMAYTPEYPNEELLNPPPCNLVLTKKHRVG